jgi:hypothetical protein
VAAGPITQTTAVKLLPEIIASEVEYAVNNNRGLIPAIWDTQETYFGPGYKIHIPVVGLYAAAAFTTGALTFTAMTETEIVLTPTVSYSAIQIEEPVLLTAVADPVKIYAPALAEAIYQKIEVDGLLQYGDFSTNTVTDAADFTEAAFQTLIAKMMSNGGDKVQPGQLTGVYHPLKWDAIFQLGNFTSAAVRGENNGPAKTGNIGMAYGVNFMFTKNVATSTTLRNLILAKKAMILCRKNRPKIEMERTDLSTKVVASMMYAIDGAHELAGGQHIITTLT